MNDERMDEYLRGLEEDAAADWTPEGGGDVRVVCPFCGLYLDELSDGRLACGNCEVAWDDPAVIERTRRELAAYPHALEE